MIPNIAKPGDFEADLKLETGNYKSMRASGMVNIPLGDTLAVRAAGAWTSREGYAFNTVTQRRLNGRDLSLTRLRPAWELDRKSGGEGKRVSVHDDIGGCR